MTSGSGLWRLLPSLSLAAVATTAGAFATNKLASNGPAWWWAVVAVSLVGLVAAGLWGYWAQTHQGRDPRPQPANATHQTAGDSGTNISMSAEQWFGCGLECGHLEHGQSTEQRIRLLSGRDGEFIWR